VGHLRFCRQSSVETTQTTDLSHPTGRVDRELWGRKDATRKQMRARRKAGPSSFASMLTPEPKDVRTPSNHTGWSATRAPSAMRPSPIGTTPRAPFRPVFSKTITIVRTCASAHRHVCAHAGPRGGFD